MLHAVTIPNVALNIINNTDDTEDDLTELPRCKFYAGDWAAFAQLLIKDTAKQKDYCKYEHKAYPRKITLSGVEVVM